MGKLSIKQNARIILKSNSKMMRNLFLLYIACEMGAFLLSALITSIYMSLRYAPTFTFIDVLKEALISENFVMALVLNQPLNWLVSLPIFLIIFYRVVYNDFTTKKVLLSFIKENKLWKKIIGLSAIIFVIDSITAYLAVMTNMFAPNRLNFNYAAPFLMSKPLFNSYIITLAISAVFLVVNTFLKLTIFYLIAHPEVGIFSAIKNTLFKTLKNIANVLKFWLSFLPWGILVFITSCIIGIVFGDNFKINILERFLYLILFGLSFYLWPYFNISKSLLYKSIFMPEERKVYKLHRLDSIKQQKAPVVYIGYDKEQ